MSSILVRLNPFRNAFLASAVFLSIAVLLTLFAPVAIASAAAGILAPGVRLTRWIGLPAGFIALLLSYYLNFAIYAIVFAAVFALAAKLRPDR